MHAVRAWIVCRSQDELQSVVHIGVANAFVVLPVFFAKLIHIPEVLS